MLLVRLKRRTKGIQIPSSTVSSPTFSEILTQKSGALSRVVKTRKFILARLNGKTISEANREAGNPPLKSSRSTLSSPIGQKLLDELVISKIPDPEVTDRMREFWDARRTVITHTKNGERIEVDLGPDFERQKYAMDKRLALGGYASGELPENRQAGIITNITFVTLDGKKEEVINVPAE